MRNDATFGAKLRWWRVRRGLSQFALADRTGVSQRHLGFLERGRASPSRQMVSRLAVALNVPLRQHNALLVAAGFSPEWRQRDLSSVDLTGVAKALDYMLAQQEPYPAVVVDRHWTLLKGNRAAVRLMEELVGPLPPDTAVNLADALVAPNVLRPHLVNWEEVVAHFVRTVEADAAADGLAETAVLLERLMSYNGVRATLRRDSGNAEVAPILPMHFKKGTTSLSLFTTIATLGTPQDVTLQELRVECFFPMDEGTETVLRTWAR